jgi:hypothetical protein
MQGVALAFLLACTVEMGWIILQAALGQHSHFNDSTAFHRMMFSVMAFAAVVAILNLIVVTVLGAVLAGIYNLMVKVTGGLLVGFTSN